MSIQPATTPDQPAEARSMARPAEPRLRSDQIAAFRDIIAQVRDREAYVLRGPAYILKTAMLLAASLETIFDGWEAYDAAVAQLPDRRAQKGVAPPAEGEGSRAEQPPPTDHTGGTPA